MFVKRIKKFLAAILKVFFTARRYARAYATICRPSVCPSICDVQVWFSHGLEYFENNFTAV